MLETTSSHRAWRCHAFGDYHDLVMEQVASPAPAGLDHLNAIDIKRLG